MFIFFEYHHVYGHIFYPNKITACICLTLQTLLSEIHLWKPVVEKANPSAKIKIAKSVNNMLLCLQDLLVPDLKLWMDVYEFYFL
jgi:hypothetical protein